MNLPNSLTLLRVALVPFFMAALLVDQFPFHFLWALFFFAVASITDHLDGRIARKYRLVSDFGKFMDPLADKILVMAAFICFIQMGLVSAIAVVIMMTREFLVTSLRLVASAKGLVVAANVWGKLKTVFQMFSILLVLCFLILPELSLLLPLPFSVNPSSVVYRLFFVASRLSVWIATFFTILSGAVYYWENRSVLIS